MKKILSLTLLLVLLGVFPVTAQESLLQKVQKAQDSLETLTARFTQLNYTFLTGKVANATGNFFYKKRGLMRWEYEAPEEQLIVLGKEKVWLFDPILENVTIQKMEKVSGVQSLDFFRGSKRLRDGFQVSKPEENFLRDSGLAYQLFLMPKKSNKEMKELQIGVDQKYRIKQMVVVDDRGNYRDIFFNNIKEGLTLDDQLFEFIVQDGMEIISE